MEQGEKTNVVMRLFHRLRGSFRLRLGSDLFHRVRRPKVQSFAGEF
jgi:hypothetical protein